MYLAPTPSSSSPPGPPPRRLPCVCHMRTYIKTAPIETDAGPVRVPRLKNLTYGNVNFILL